MFEESAITTFSAIQGSTTKEENASTGGVVKTFEAAGALNIGDYVFLTGVGVNKSATATDYVNAVGVVVGGTSTLMIADFSEEAVGNEACSAAGEQVIVALAGSIVYVTSGAAITAMSRVIPAATAGRVTPGSTATQVLGIVLEEATGAAEAVKMFIRHS